jgi:uncharacterized protein
MAEGGLIAVEVVVAERERQSLVTLAVPAGTTARQALEISGLRARHPQVPAAGGGLAIFGREVPDDYVLRPGDRVEWLRPLPDDPRSRRRQLARQGRTMGRDSGGRR